MKRENRRHAGKGIGTVLVSMAFWLVIWEVAVKTRFVAEGVLPPPHLVLRKMFSVAFFETSGGFGVVQTFGWSVLGWASGTVAGLSIVALAIKFGFVGRSLAFLLLAGRSVPSVVAVPIFAAVFGMGRPTGFLCAVFLCLCYSVPTLEESMRATLNSKRLLQEALGLPMRDSLVLITIPGIGRAVRAIGVQSFGIALVVTVASEMILSLKGTVGYEVGQLAWLLRMTEVYAFVGWLILCSVALNGATLAVPWLLTFPARRLVRRMQGRLGAREARP